MKLTAAQKKRLAVEARKLAGQFANGSGPEVTNSTWCDCGLGHVMLAAGLRPDLFGDPVGNWLDKLVSPGLMTTATMEAMDGNPGAMVFPLLATADAIEESAQP